MQMKNFIAVFIIFTWLGHSYGQEDFDLVKSTVSKDVIKSHIYFLAADELKGRETGSHEGNVAALYLANQLRKYGVQDVPGTDRPYFQDVRINKLQPPQKFLLKYGEKSSENLLWIKGYNVNKTAKAVFVNFGSADDFQSKDVKGKWVISRAGTQTGETLQEALAFTATKRGLAQEAGAIGLIEVIEAPQRTWRSLSFYFNRQKNTFEAPEAFPHIWASLEDLNADSFTDNSELQLVMEGIQSTEMQTQNVVGIVEGSDPELKKEFVIYSAHYDHVGIGKPDQNQDSVYNGARDNAVGSVTVLSAAENIARYPTKRSALFIFFTAEEKGLLGSNYYVNHPLLPLEQMVFCFNSDNGGYNDTSISTIIGLNRSTVAPHILKANELAGLKAIDDPAPEQNLFDRSDNVHFAAQGIPAPSYSMGFTAFDKEISRFYHRPGDQADNLDYEYLYKFFLSYVLSGRYIANDPKKPFWVEGDKYYEAGKKLYEK